MEGVGRGREAGMLRDFAVQHRWELLLLEDAYTQGCYGCPATREQRPGKALRRLLGL